MIEIFLLLGLGLVIVAIMNEMNQPGAVVTVADATGDSEVLTGSPGIVTVEQSKPGKFMQFADAIFHFEGGKSGSLNVRNNNPGNLKYAGQPGATADAKGFAVFNTTDDGWAALYRQLQKTVGELPQLDLNQFFARYLGQPDYMNPRATDQGDPFAYAKFVAARLGVSSDQTLGQIFGG